MNRTDRLLLVGLIVLLVIALAFPMALGGLTGMHAMRGEPGGMMGSSWSMGLIMGLGGLAAIAFWAALIVGVALLARVLSGASAAQTETPLDILQRRYASGEIDDEQFQRMRTNLLGGVITEPGSEEPTDPPSEQSEPSGPSA